MAVNVSNNYLYIPLFLSLSLVFFTPSEKKIRLTVSILTSTVLK